MTRAFVLLFANLIALYLPAQYYLRGEIRDEAGKPLSNIKFNIASKGNFPYFTGAGGEFGIPTPLKIDTISITADGYEYFTTPVRSARYEVFVLKMTAAKSQASKQRLASITRHFLSDRRSQQLNTGESYSSTVENEFVNARKYHETGFAVNVNRASYSNIRRFLNMGTIVPPDAIRIEEMLNYFNLSGKQEIDNEETFSVNTALTNCPWNNKSALFFINLQAKKISLATTPPSNLVFLIDVSGSMDMPNRLPLLKTGFKLLVQNLRDIDTVSVISYANGVSVMLQPTSGKEKQKIIEAIEGLSPAGATSGEAAILTAYRFAAKGFIRGGNNRVVLATDGDFNVGMNSDKELEELIVKQRTTGIYLTCLGVGMGNYKDSKLEALAKKGNGNFAYLDNEYEAKKVLVEEFAQNLFNVANDVYIDVLFNASVVNRYRLIGFDNKQAAVADSISDLEGGEVGSGQKLMSVFEVELDTTIDKLSRYSVAELKLTYSFTENAAIFKKLINTENKLVPINTADSALRLAGAIIMFGSVLKQSDFLKDVNFDDVYNLAITGASPNDRLQMEFLEMIQKAKKIYTKKKNRKS